MSLPSTMKVIAHGAGGPPSVMSISQAPLPTVGKGELLIKVAFAGVNRPDVLQRSGSYPPPPGASPYLGLEVSGTVAALGEGVEGFRIGDEVCALCNGGGYAEYASVPAGQVLPVPRGLGLDLAAAIPENYFTVWINVFDRGGLVAGETALIHGGSSGIGLTAIRLAKAFGAKVFTTVGNAEKAKACSEAGADVTINYREQDFVDVVARETGKQGVNFILDMVGGSYIGRNLKSLAIEGRLSQIAFLEGARAEVDFTPVMIKRLTLTGSTLRPRTAEDKAKVAQALRNKVWPLIEKGQARPSVFRTFPMAEAVQAHELMESSNHIGKILLKVA